MPCADSLPLLSLPLFSRPPPSRFLPRAGAAAADTGSGRVGARWAQQYHHPPVPAPPPPEHHHNQVGRPVPRPLGVGAGPVLDALYHDGHGGAAAGRKRGAEGGAAEKTVERRKKRMIKNRESAARSRARKQAYTNELENKISRLEEENERLRRHKVNEAAMAALEERVEFLKNGTSSMSSSCLIELSHFEQALSKVAITIRTAKETL